MAELENWEIGKKESVSKTFVLDTNILMSFPTALFGFGDNEVVIPSVVLEELDSKKNAGGNTGYNVRETARMIQNMLLDKGGSLTEGIPTKEGGIIKVAHINKTRWKNGMPEEFDLNKNDNLIIAFVLSYAEQNYDRNVILVTNDIYMMIKAKTVGINAEPYNNTRIALEDVKYRGRREIITDSSTMERFYQRKELEWPTDGELMENEYVILRNGSCSAIGRYRKGRILPLTSDMNPFDIIPKNVGQKFAIDALMAPASEIPLVFLKGDAGTSKTFLALACGLEAVVERKEYDQILYVRPNIKFDEDIGYLKGSEKEKIAPLVRPMMDNLRALFRKIERREEREDAIQDLFDRGYIQTEAMAYMRGRSIDNTFVILDESQNATPKQMLGILTRLGWTSKVVVTGDYKQVDNPKLDSQNNGLVIASERMKGSKICAQVAFGKKECVRSPLAAEAAARLTE